MIKSLTSQYNKDARLFGIQHGSQEVNFNCNVELTETRLLSAGLLEKDTL
jgi:hypothetical protein